jgi:hypothetical protein
MAKVTYANMFSESRNNVVSLVSNTSNVADPTTSTAEFRKWIYAREPDVKDINFKGFPYIIVHPSDVDIEEKGGSVDGKSKTVSWNIEVEIVTCDRGYGTKDGLGLSHMDTLSDSLLKTFLDKTNRSTLRTASMYFSAPVTTAVSDENFDNTKIYRRSIMLPFKGRMQVSA